MQPIVEPIEVKIKEEPKPQKLAINTIIGQYDWNQEVAYRIMFCESSKDPKAYNPEQHKGCKGSFGLFQIACVHSGFVDNLEELFEPEINIKVAYQLYKRDGWRIWSCY